MKLVRTKFDFLVDFSQPKDSRIIKEGTLLKVNGFNSFNVFLNPPFDIDKENPPINSSNELGLFVQSDIFLSCFEVLTEEETRQLKFG